MSRPRIMVVRGPALPGGMGLGAAPTRSRVRAVNAALVGLLAAVYLAARRREAEPDVADRGPNETLHDEDSHDETSHDLTSHDETLDDLSSTRPARHALPDGTPPRT